MSSTDTAEQASALTAFIVALAAYHRAHPMGSGIVGMDFEPITQQHEVYTTGRAAMDHYAGSFPGANDGVSDWFWILIESSRNKAAPCHERSGSAWRLLQWCKGELARLSKADTNPAAIPPMSARAIAADIVAHCEKGNADSVAVTVRKWARKAGATKIGNDFSRADVLKILRYGAMHSLKHAHREACTHILSAFNKAAANLKAQN